MRRHCQVKRNAVSASLLAVLTHEASHCMHAPHAMPLWHVHMQDLSHSLHILDFSVPRDCSRLGSIPESLDADAPKATGSKTLFMALLASVGLLVTAICYGFSMIHILVKGK